MRDRRKIALLLAATLGAWLLYRDLFNDLRVVANATDAAQETADAAAADAGRALEQAEDADAAAREARDHADDMESRLLWRF